MSHTHILPGDKRRLTLAEEYEVPEILLHELENKLPQFHNETFKKISAWQLIGFFVREGLHKNRWHETFSQLEARGNL